jgi:hypothetical protein
VAKACFLDPYSIFLTVFRSVFACMVVPIFITDKLRILNHHITTSVFHNRGMVLAKGKNPFLGIVKQLWVFLTMQVAPHLVDVECILGIVWHRGEHHMPVANGLFLELVPCERAYVQHSFFTVWKIFHWY